MARFLTTYYLSSRKDINQDNKQTKVITAEDYHEVIARLQKEHTIIKFKYIRNMNSEFYSYYDVDIYLKEQNNNYKLKLEKEEIQDMRPIERIPIFLKLLNWDKFLLSLYEQGYPKGIDPLEEGEDGVDVMFEITSKWLANPDWRFGQLLINMGLIPDHIGVWTIEDNDILKNQGIPLREYLLWGTYGKDGKQPLVYKPIKDLESDHIQAILDTQGHITDKYKKVLADELTIKGSGEED